MQLEPDVIAFQGAARHCPWEIERKAERDACLAELPAEIVSRGQAAIRELNGVSDDTDLVKLIVVPPTALPSCDNPNLCRGESYYADCVHARGFAIEEAMLAPAVCLHERSVSECGLAEYTPELGARVAAGKPWVHDWEASLVQLPHVVQDDCTTAERRTLWLRGNRE